LRQSGCAVNAALCKRAFDLLRSNQRARRVVHTDIFRVVANPIQTSPNGILPKFTARENRADFFEPCVGSDFSNLIMPLFTRDEDDFAHAIGVLKRADCVGDHWFVRDYGKQFIEPHALAAAAGYENR
jgi:hypothetical protein